MADKRHVQHLRSKVVENGGPKLPESSSLYVGEIAINYAKGHETISMKNDNEEIVTFTNDNYYSDVLGTKVNNSDLDGKIAEAISGNASVSGAVVDIVDGKLASYSSATEVESALANKADKVHTHAISDVTDLQTALDGKANSVHTHSASDITDFDDAVASAITADSSVVDSVNDVISAFTENTLDNRYATKEHTHSITGVTGLQDALDGKSDTSHTHTHTAITDFDSAVASAITGSQDVQDAINEVVESQIEGAISRKADTSAVTEAIDAATSGKVDTSDYEAYTAATDTLIASKLSIEDFNAYSAATDTLIGTKLNTADFNSYSSATETLIETKLNTSDFNAYSAATDTLIGTKLNTSDFNAYSSATETLIGSKFGGAEYDSETKRINFYTSSSKTGDVLGYIDATAFIKDGMVDTVTISNGNLVITFNTDSGKEAITIPLTDIFDPNNYYDKDAIDDLVGSGFTGSTITEVINENELTVSSALNDLNTRVTDLDDELDNKSDVGHTHTASEITDFSNAVGDAITASTQFTDLSNTVNSHTGNTSVHLASSDINSLSGNASVLSAITSTNVSDWNDAATNSHTHANKAVLDAITGSVGTMAYEDAASYSSATEVNTALADKADAVHTHESSAITSMAGYSKPSVTSAIVTSDTLNQAIGKLEKAIETAAGGGITGVTLESGTNNGTLKLTVNDVSTDNIAVKGLGGAAYLNTGTTAGTVAAGNHNHEGVYQPVGSYLTGITSTQITTALGYTPANSSDVSSKVGTATTVTGTNGLTGGGALSGNVTIGLETTGTSGTYGPNADVTGSNGSTIKVPQITVDNYGRVTSVSERTYTSVDTTGATPNDGALKVSGNTTLAATFTANQSNGTNLVISGGSPITVSASSGKINITHATGNGYNHIPSGGSTGQFLKWSSSGVAQWAANPDTNYYITGATVTTAASKFDVSLTGNDTSAKASFTIPSATTSAAGVMTAADKTALNNLNPLSGNVSTLSAITATSTAINSLTGSVGTMAFNNASDYYTKNDLTGSSTTVVVAKATSAATAASVSSVALSNVTGADDLKKIEALTGTSGLLKKTATNTWSLDTTSYSSATQVNNALSGKQDTLAFDGTYSSSTNKVATVSTVTNAINALDGGTIGTGSTSKTITSLTQSDGNVSATFADIEITSGAVTNFASAVKGVVSDAISGDASVSGAITSAINSNENVVASKNMSDYFTGHNTASSLANLPKTKRLVIVTGITGDTNSLSVSGGSLQDGYDLHLIVQGTAGVNITLPTSSPYVCFSETVVIGENGYCEINILSDGTTLYVRGV